MVMIIIIIAIEIVILSSIIQLLTIKINDIIIYIMVNLYLL